MDEKMKRQLKEEIGQFRETADQFMRKEITMKEFKG